MKTTGKIGTPEWIRSRSSLLTIRPSFGGGLRMLSAQELAISVVGEAADDLQAIRLAEVLAD